MRHFQGRCQCRKSKACEVDSSKQLIQSFDLLRTLNRHTILPGRQSRHGAHGSNQGIQETSADGGPDFSNGNGESLRSALPRRIGRQREMRLRHANGKIVESLSSISFDLLGSQRRNFDAVSCVKRRGRKRRANRATYQTFSVRPRTSIRCHVRLSVGWLVGR